MKVSPDIPFELIYSIYQHEYLGYLVESFVVQKNEKGNLTFVHQNISHKNAQEFSENLDDNDFKLIQLIDEIQQDHVANFFQKKKQRTDIFFLKTYDKTSGNKVLQKEISLYINRRMAKIMELMPQKRLFEMGKDGEPTWKEIKTDNEQATILFHFRKNEDNTHYFPTIKLGGEKVEFLNNESYLPCNEPAWMIANWKLFTFEKTISATKLKPFLKKKFILIPKDIEDTYYRKFVAPLVAEFDVYAKGFEIETNVINPSPKITISELHTQSAGSLFDQPAESKEESKLLMELSFEYGKHSFQADKLNKVNVYVEQEGDNYTFHRIKRDQEKEKQILQKLSESGLAFRHSRVTISKSKAFEWIGQNPEILKEFTITQNQKGKKFFTGESSINIEVSEGIDWFDLKATIMFGEYEVPFDIVRKCIISGKTEVKLPNGEVGVIPESWIERYKDLFYFSTQTDDGIQLNKAHISLLQELKDSEYAKVTMDRKLEQLLSFDEIEEYAPPKGLNGELRPYQQAGYNWLRFLDEYNFGGCLADDMGLGKTIQAISLLLHQKEAQKGSTSLLVLPTSLLYNWEIEVNKFAPQLSILNYTGTNREKNSALFSKYDLIITSYGIMRIDTDILSEFYFNYIILDEAQAIKNPNSQVSKKIKLLKSRRKLTLTGTPLENSTLDLWSQMSFVNPGLLGSESFFKKQYQIPIEKKKDLEKTQKLNGIIKPFMLRREKSQVAKDLPEKIINVRYCTMSEDQKELYEQEKNSYKAQIISTIEEEGLAKSQMTLLKGLSQLRQIANHPKMVDKDYEGTSGKLEEFIHLLSEAMSNNHKILVFSQFVKHLKILEQHLKTENITYSYLDGATRDRQKEVDRFQTDESVRVFLISLKAGGTGLNLTKADYVFLLDPWWNPAAEAQAIDRAHRIGQDKTVFAYKFITKDTIEEKILKLQEHKQELASGLITIEESFIKSLSQEDISQLFD